MNKKGLFKKWKTFESNEAMTISQTNMNFMNGKEGSNI